MLGSNCSTGCPFSVDLGLGLFAQAQPSLSRDATRPPPNDNQLQRNGFGDSAEGFGV